MVFRLLIMSALSSRLVVMPKMRPFIHERNMIAANREVGQGGRKYENKLNVFLSDDAL